MQRRDAVLGAMKDHPISQRRACVLIGVDPKTVRRERPPDNPEIREEMHKIGLPQYSGPVSVLVHDWS